jgi:hypothetical protein
LRCALRFYDAQQLAFGDFRTSSTVHPSSDKIDFIKVYFDFQNTLCVSIEFGSYATRNMFP